MRKYFFKKGNAPLKSNFLTKKINGEMKIRPDIAGRPKHTQSF